MVSRQERFPFGFGFRVCGKAKLVVAAKVGSVQTSGVELEDNSEVSA